MPDIISDRAGFSQSELISHGMYVRANTVLPEQPQSVQLSSNIFCVGPVVIPNIQENLDFKSANIAGFLYEIIAPERHKTFKSRLAIERKDNYY